MCPSTGPVTYGKRESRQNRRFVPLATLSKGEELPDGGRSHVFEPAVKSLTAVVANAGPGSCGSALVPAKAGHPSA
jgi:hypothetical protein